MVFWSVLSGIIFGWWIDKTGQYKYYNSNEQIERKAKNTHTSEEEEIWVKYEEWYRHTHLREQTFLFITKNNNNSNFSLKNKLTLPLANFSPYTYTKNKPPSSNKILGMQFSSMYFIEFWQIFDLILQSYNIIFIFWNIRWCVLNNEHTKTSKIKRNELTYVYKHTHTQSIIDSYLTKNRCTFNNDESNLAWIVSMYILCSVQCNATHTHT